MLNLTIKIRLHLQKSSHLFFSPKIAIFVLSCKEIRRRRRRNGQAGARPCKMTVGDAGTETENRCNSLIYIGLTFVRKHLYPALFSLLLETFFVSEFAQKKKILICISTPYNRITIFLRSKAVPIKVRSAPTDSDSFIATFAI